MKINAGDNVFLTEFLPQLNARMSHDYFAENIS